MMRLVLILDMSSHLSANAQAAPVTVSGQVINAVTGKPVSRALVRFEERATLTNFEGRFRFYGVTENGNVQVTKPGFSMSSDPFDLMMVPLQLDHLPELVTIPVYPEALVTVHLSGQDNEPLQGIYLNAQRAVFDGSARRMIGGGGAMTDSHGDARIPLQAGEYQIATQYIPRSVDLDGALLPLIVPAQTSGNRMQTITLRSGDEIHLDLHAQRRRTFPINLRLEGLPDHAMPNIIAVSSDGARLNANSQSDSPSDGTAHIELPGGSYALTARVGTANGMKMAEASITVTDHGLEEMTLSFLSVPNIPVEVAVDAGVTSDNSNPPNVNQLGLFLEAPQTAPDNGSSYIALQRRQDNSSSFTVPFGTYRFRSRGSGEWYIKSADYGGSNLLQENLVSAAGAGGVPIRVVVSKETGSLQGTTLLAGRATAGWIYLLSTTPSAQPLITSRSGNDGSFAIPCIPPGSYQAFALEARKSADFTDPATIASFAPRTQTLNIQAGEKNRLNFDLVPAAEMLP
jgi:hypothetical protein